MSTRSASHLSGFARCALTLVVVSCAGCSDHSSTRPASSLRGGSIDAYLPMHDGDVYEFDTGWKLRISKATSPNLGAGPVMRVEFDDGFEQFGFYWSHGSARGSLYHGGFDTLTDREEIFEPELPIWPMRPITQDYKMFSMGSHAALGTGTAAYRMMTVRSSTNTPQLLFVPTPFGVWKWGEMRELQWVIDLDDGDRQRHIELEMYSGPGFGPLQIKIDGQVHRTTRATVDGVIHNGW